MLSGGGLRVLVPRELAYDNRDGQWRWRDDIPPRNRRLAMTPAEIDDLLDRGFPLPEWHTPPAVARELARARPPRRHRGPGRLLHRPFRLRQVDDRPRPGRRAAGDRRAHDHAARRRRGAPRALRRAGLQQGRPRRATSAGSAGSRPRSARHGGMAICCPIAPYESARAAARAMAADGRGRLRAGARGDPAGGLRAARPQGPVREGPGRPDHAA